VFVCLRCVLCFCVCLSSLYLMFLCLFFFVVSYVFVFLSSLCLMFLCFFLRCILCFCVCLSSLCLTHIYTIATLLTWFTYIPPNTHIQNRYSPDMVHTYTTIYVFGGICVNHVRRVAIVYMCIWWYMCEPCQESSDCVYV
jgi:hypothetical protein